MSDQSKEETKRPEGNQEIDSASSVAISIEEEHTEKLPRISNETVLEGTGLAVNTEVKTEDTVICIQDEIQAKPLYTSVAMGFQIEGKQDEEILEEKAAKPPSVLFGMRKFWVFQEQQQQAQQPQPYQSPRTPRHADDGDEDRPQGPHLGKLGHTPENEPLDYKSRDPEERNAFVRLVFIITFVMLLFTFSFMFYCHNSAYMRRFMFWSLEAMCLYILSVVALFSVNYIFCCSNCAKVVPWNFVLITIATLAYSWIVAFTAMKYSSHIILAALGITMGVVIACFLLALTDFDFTKFLLLLIVFSVSLGLAFISGLLMDSVFDIPMSTFKMVVLCISSVVSSLMLIVELQMILGGKTVELGEDEYAYGAYLIYTSIIDLFLKFLYILNKLIGKPLPV